ncbi:MAG: HEPN domain-containing protein [Actinomycetota bacterium]|nr:HEPN domain-containing protein [Actinomycetota bacterium]
MSPRSAELLVRARQGIASAQLQVGGGHAATAVSTAYYAMLYAARAALSERDRHARSHAGTWSAFREEFVLTRQFEEGLAQDAQRAQARREASDYAAATFELAEARELLATSERFVAAVERLTST